MATRPRVLIVEDDTEWQRKLKNLLEHTLEEHRDHEVGGLRVEVAGWVEQARELIETAKSENDPFEAVLLDLGLPLTEKEFRDQLADEGQNGLDLLSEITATHDIAVVILTVYYQQRIILQALRRGAFDFFGKRDFAGRDAQAQILTRMIKAVGKTRESLFDRLQWDRLHWLTEHQGKNCREQLTNIVSDRAAAITEQLDDLTETLQRDYGLEPDRESSDTACQQMAHIKAAVNEFPQSLWQEYTERLKPARLETTDVGAELTRRVNKVRPCYFHRAVTLHWKAPREGTTETRTFGEDLGLMLDELIVGSLDTSPPGSKLGLSCSKADNKSIIIEAKVTRTPSGKRTDIYVPRPRNGIAAEEGLTLLRRIASNMGAGINIDVTADRTTVNVSIPVMT